MKKVLFALMVVFVLMGCQSTTEATIGENVIIEESMDIKVGPYVELELLLKPLTKVKTKIYELPFEVNLEGNKDSFKFYLLDSEENKIEGTQLDELLYTSQVTNDEFVLFERYNPLFERKEEFKWDKTTTNISGSLYLKSTSILNRYTFCFESDKTIVKYTLSSEGMVSKTVDEFQVNGEFADYLNEFATYEIHSLKEVPLSLLRAESGPIKDRLYEVPVIKNVVVMDITITPLVESFEIPELALVSNQNYGYDTNVHSYYVEGEQNKLHDKTITEQTRGYIIFEFQNSLLFDKEDPMLIMVDRGTGDFDRYNGISLNGFEQH